MNVTQVVPASSEPVPLDRLLAGLRDPAARPRPWAPETLELAHRLSRALFHDPAARAFPELQALAFWLRKSEMSRLQTQFDAGKAGSTVLVPRGLVFHVPPSNVDTIFIYSWIVSALAGNANLIRLSDRAGNATVAVCRLFAEALKDAPDVLRSSTAIIRYDRSDEITAAISMACDVRVLWGGDASVNALRAFAVPPHARDLTFPDRHSFSLIKAASYAALSDTARRELAARFYNDTFWFDQTACSSPRLVVWVGEQSACEMAAQEFFDALAEEVRAKEYNLPTGPRLNKLAFAYRAIIDRPVDAHRTFGTEITVLRLSSIRTISREHCGGGLLFQGWAREAAEIASLVERKDQTLTHFGFDAAELRQLAVALNGRGIDRMVPIGQALTFNRFWDGYDLLREFTRTVYLEP